MLGLSLSVQAQTYENQFSRPLGDVLNDIQSRFQVRLKYDIDTVGKVFVQKPTGRNYLGISIPSIPTGLHGNSVKPAYVKRFGKKWESILF